MREKIKKNELAEILAKFTEDISKELPHALSDIKQNDHSRQRELRLEFFILNMFLMTWVCQKQKFPKDLLDVYHRNMYEKIANLLPWNSGDTRHNSWKDVGVRSEKIPHSQLPTPH